MKDPCCVVLVQGGVDLGVSWVGEVGRGVNEDGGKGHEVNEEGGKRIRCVHQPHVPIETSCFFAFVSI